ncbi:unnamed protein product [Rhodiola kirilowii]
MESGSIVNKWMLEFAIIDLKDDGLITKMLSAVPPMLKDDVGLKKIILLRAIESEVAEFSVSEKTLDALEITFELDRKEGLNVLDSMKTAYCSVAVDCLARVVKSTGEGEMYLDAVKRIWRKRIGQLFAHNVDLVSEQLETWRDNIETAIWDNNLRSKLFGSDTRYEALQCIKEYLNEAWETVGPNFTSRTSGKSLVEAQLLCLQRISEPGKAEALRSFDTPSGSGDNHNPTAQYKGKVLKGPRDLSSLVSSPLLKNKDRESSENTLNQNHGYNSKNITGNKPEEGSKAFLSTNTVDLCHDGFVRLAVPGIAKEKNLLQTSDCLILDQLKNVEPVIVKVKVVEEAASPLPIPGVCASNSCDHVDHVKGACISVDKEKKADLSREVSRKVGVRRKQVGGPRKLSKRVWINDSEDVDPEGSNRQHNSLSEMEVIKVHEEFKTSSRELKDVVKDPLPDALHAAEAILSDSARNCVPQDALAGSISDTDTLKSSGDEVERGKDEALTSHLNEARTSGMEGNTMNLKNNQGYETDPVDVTNNVSSPIAVDHVDNNFKNERSGHANLQRRANLWERNASAQIYEWDNSVDGCPEENISLPTPKTYVNSPLKKYECTKFARRRKVKRWSVLEEDTLRDGVRRYGVGNWKLILNAYRGIFEERNEVDLKDKWRRMAN